MYTLIVMFLNLSWKCRLEVQQIKVWFGDGAASSTDNGVNSPTRLLQQIRQPVLHVALEYTGIQTKYSHLLVIFQVYLDYLD